jgi:hypothetical protein
VILRAARAALLVTGLIAGFASGVSAQTEVSTLTVTGGSTIAFANPTFADYVAGYIDGPTITFTASTVGGGSQPRMLSVEICASNATLGSGKAVSKLMWQPTDNSLPYQSMSTGCSAPGIVSARVVGAQAISRGNSWSGGVRLRLMLDWTDAAASYGSPIELALTVTP